MTHHIGVMGMGIMGQAMAINLLNAGYPVTVYNRTVEAATSLATHGANVAATPEELGQHSDIIIVMLTGPEAIDALLWDATSTLSKGALVINMSTVPPEFARSTAQRLEAAGLHYLDAPVSGSKKPAEEGNLVILAGGDPDSLSEAQPVFDVLGKKTVHCGEAGQGSMMKMAINLLLGVMMEGYAEMIALGTKGGLDLETMQAVVANGPLNSGLFQMKEEMFRTNTFTPQFPLKHMAKDMHFLSETASSLDVDIPSAKRALEQYSRADGMGLGDMDFAAVIQALNS